MVFQPESAFLQEDLMIMEGVPPMEREASRAWSFVSAPGLHPMKVKINVKKQGTAQGLIFTAPYAAYGEPFAGQTGALIMDQNGNPVWFRPLDSRYIQNTDFKVQEYKGEPVLTLWQGTISGTQSADSNLPGGDPEPGACYQIIDRHYNIIEQLWAQKDFTADVHEFTVTGRNTALFTAICQVPSDLSSYEGPSRGFIDNYSIQEVDIETGKLLFFWDVLAHVDPADSMVPAASSEDTNNIWDCFHVNSVEEGSGDTLLVSMRNMWAIYCVDKGTGKILWQLGGKKSDFTFGPNASFSWQHDARYLSDDRISLFDDACCASGTSRPQGPARGLVLKLDFRNRLAWTYRTYYHDPLLYVASQGNVQTLYNKNRFIGWGQKPYASEFSQEGNLSREPSESLLYDMEFPESNMTYRAFKCKWTGQPLCPPSIAVKEGQSGTSIYASWNGSTETAAWQVLAGPACNRLSTIVQSTPKTGFETRIDVNSMGPYFRVNALTACGKVIGRSNIVKPARK